MRYQVGIAYCVHVAQQREVVNLAAGLEATYSVQPKSNALATLQSNCRYMGWKAICLVPI